MAVPAGDSTVSQEGGRYQALYRRFRPQRFADVLGQEHVTRALLRSVQEGKVAHAYLFSGPRGTGKTSTARILAMALNCEHPEEGEPDGSCPSCVAIRQGSSLDVQELDSATNRGIDEMKDLLSRVSLGTPGRWKVYIVDEVHQLTTQAASALLKTLEEPPGHVIFVLATTDPQKVMPTIRSRTQHFEFRLLGADVLSGLLSDVNTKASLGLPAEAIDFVVKRGHGSARDALSALDQVAAAGGPDEESAVVADLVAAIGDHDPGRVLLEVADAAISGRDPRRIATDILEYLRNGFLATQARSLVMLPDEAAEEAEAQARRLGTATVVRAMEGIGQALIDMRDAPDPRITLEVALVRVASPESDNSPAALLERIERLERAVARGGAASGAMPSGGVASAGVAEAPAPPQGQDTEAVPPGRVPKPALGAHRRAAPPAPSAPSVPPAHAAPAQAVPPAQVAGAAALPTREELTMAWGDTVLPSLRPAVKVYLAAGRFVAVEDGAAVFAVPDQGLLTRAEPLKGEAETALAQHFGRPVPLRLVLEPGSAQATQAAATALGGPAARRGGVGSGDGVSGAPSTADFPEDAEPFDLSELQDAPAGALTPEQRLLQAFPGAEEVSP